MEKYEVGRFYKKMYKFVVNCDAAMAVKYVYRIVIKLIFELFGKNCLCLIF